MRNKRSTKNYEYVTFMDNIALCNAHFRNGSRRIGQNRDFHLHGLQNHHRLTSGHRGASNDEDLEDRSNHFGLNFDRHRLGVRTLAVVGAALLAVLLLTATLAHGSSSVREALSSHMAQSGQILGAVGNSNLPDLGHN